MSIKPAAAHPPEVACQFAADMKAYHDDIRRDGIAVGTRHMLLEHMPAGQSFG
ncbi:hypothetical protein HU675_0037260 [Bradyrhizobium septentrionale]|uniref:hypothetical protein n=1 Tax=Bradyrhizobium septentrionale TaxID=1404411 RepID=UPI00159665C5|nr:hypothetical protein [Bradyrhizobium septentrionale]UGY23548.1 hypothetical protein HU675_0037260 [Bradyrhizobium septentrionale]